MGVLGVGVRGVVGGVLEGGVIGGVLGGGVLGGVVGGGVTGTLHSPARSSGASIWPTNDMVSIGSTSLDPMSW